MTKLNIILFITLIAVCLGVVTAQNKARKLYSELDQQKELSKKYETEYGQLQLEQSTWAMHSRVEDMATRNLHMQVPDAKRIQVISLDEVRKSEVDVRNKEVEVAEVKVAN